MDQERVKFRFAPATFKVARQNKTSEDVLDIFSVVAKEKVLQFTDIFEAKSMHKNAEREVYEETKELGLSLDSNDTRLRVSTHIQCPLVAFTWRIKLGNRP